MRSSRYAAQGLGSILDIAEARVREVDADLDRAEALIFAAQEGAYTPRLHCEPNETSCLSPNPVGAQPEVTEYPPGNTMNVTLGDLGFVLALGVCIGLGLGLAVFVASQVVIGWFN